MKHNKTWVVIPAAGVGKRMQADLPKQYLKLHGRTVIEHTLGCFISHPDIAGLVIAVQPDDPHWRKLDMPDTLPVYTVAGGQERADSVRNALHFLLHDLQQGEYPVLVHDAARPCLLKKDLDRLLKLRNHPDGAILAMPVRDTMKREHQGCIDHTVERQQLWHALTPQLFGIQKLHQVLGSALDAGVSITDEASAMEYAGCHPVLVEGEASNIKITRPADLELAAFFLQQKQALCRSPR